MIEATVSPVCPEPTRRLLPHEARRIDPETSPESEGAAPTSTYLAWDRRLDETADRLIPEAVTLEAAFPAVAFLEVAFPGVAT
ncbi:hypothetical protein [Aporhodopirellula aestuarii]|uniref:Uncharacterized protein n=1 Tax=Aporhodopirellula aestuarii TaxID=2950107 RepID=A0ABT0UC38_9BACT|nr:hypothetical protein [Aporhodopirellula aestuarii]MCM2373901.1 hypothetical protein [Aporhodopirellula aestuarii]